MFEGKNNKIRSVNNSITNITRSQNKFNFSKNCNFIIYSLKNCHSMLIVQSLMYIYITYFQKLEEIIHDQLEPLPKVYHDNVILSFSEAF